MKVVLFCGGEGFQLPGQIEPIPKPMSTIGYRPILWHVMRYYAYWGFNDFLLCLGFRGDVVKNYFLRYNEALSNDFVWSEGGRKIDLLSTDIDDWKITFVNTGMNTNIGQRLKAVRHHLELDEMFCVNYADNLTDAPLIDLVNDFKGTIRVGAVLSVRPQFSFHMASHRPDGVVTEITDLQSSDLWVNGGNFIFRREILDYIDEGEDLVEEPFQRLIACGELITYRHDGFWTALDTLKDLQNLQALHDGGRPPWAPWLQASSSGPQQ